MSILRKRQKRALACDFSLWGRLDSNQRPTDYESVALTN
jgi:hypothetical protein